MTDGVAYHWPTPYDPGSTKCLVVMIPDDPLYWGIFWDRYEYLGKWVTWQRESTKTATLVAQVWQPLIDQSRALFEQNPTIYIDTRQSAGDPLIIEGLKPCGTWETIIDLNGECGSGSQVTPSPYTTNNPDDQAAYAANVTEWIRILITDVVASYCAGDSQYQTFEIWRVKTEPHISAVSIVDKYNELYTTLQTLDCGTTPVNEVTVHKFDQIYNTIQCGLDATIGWTGNPPGEGYDPDPTLTRLSNNLAGVLNWMSAQIAGSLNHMSAWLIDALNTTASMLDPSAMNSISQSMGYTDSGVYTTLCDWEVEFCLADGTFPPYSFLTILPDPLTDTITPDTPGEEINGTWGLGIYGTYHEMQKVSTGLHEKHFGFVLQLPDTDGIITQIEIECLFEAPYKSPLARMYAGNWSGDRFQAGILDQFPGALNYNQWKTIQFPADGYDLSGAQLYCKQSTIISDPQEPGNCAIRCLKYTGTGYRTHQTSNAKAHYTGFE